MPNHGLRNEGCLWRTMFNVSAQLAKWAALLTCCALESPNPPPDKANVASTWASSGADGVPKIARRHPQTAVSWRSTKPSVRSGWTDLNQKFALVEPHMWSNKKASDELRLANGHTKHSQALLIAWQLGVPSPNNCVGPHQTCHSGQLRNVLGSTPPRFHTLVLPWWRWMPA